MKQTFKARITEDKDNYILTFDKFPEWLWDFLKDANIKVIRED